MTKDRLNISWYMKRTRTNQIIKNFLIDHIKKYNNEEYLLLDSTTHMKYLNYEDLLELAIGVTSKDINITLGEGEDFDNGWDAKMYSVRTHSKGLNYSASVNAYNKEKLAVCIFEPIQEKFYFFAIENCKDMKYVSIPFELNGDPKRVSKGISNEWWSYEKESLADMVSSFSLIPLRKS